MLWSGHKEKKRLIRVRSGLIQASRKFSPDTMTMAAIKKAILAKHVKLIGQAGRAESADSLPAGAL